MNKRNAIFVKTIAVITSMVTVAISALMIFAVVFMLKYDFYINPLSQVQERYLTERLKDKMYETASFYHSDEDFDMRRYLGYTNFLITVYDEFGNELSSNYEGQDYLVRTVMVIKGSELTSTDDPFLQSIEYTVVGYINAELKYNDSVYAANRLITASYNNKYLVAVIGFIASVASVLLIVFLMVRAGRSDSDGTTSPGILDKIPADVLIALYSVLAFLEIRYVFSQSNLALSIGIVVLDYLIVLHFLMSIAVRYRCQTLIKNNVISQLVIALKRACTALWRVLAHVFINISMVVKTAIIMLAILVAGLIIIMLEPAIGISVFSALWLVTTVLMLLFSIGLEKIRIAIKGLSKGETGKQIDLKMMFGATRQTASQLNDIDSGLAASLEAQIKSERFKAELITNVSHDLKTPLTSIVSYIDLLKKEGAATPVAEEYIEILERQSARLKKLTEDLVEASRASSGNLEIHAMPCELTELIMQTAGEYQDRLEAGGLEFITVTGNKSVFILADGRHLWRVFDNLMNNILKYAQPGTRVYLSLEDDGDSVRIVFRNTSKYELNISGDELTERFVRGDRSRSTQGHGLGLSIAKSLTELQGGKFNVVIDGDLFKVIVQFRKHVGVS